MSCEFSSPKRDRMFVYATNLGYGVYWRFETDTDSAVRLSTIRVLLTRVPGGSALKFVPFFFCLYARVEVTFCLVKGMDEGIPGTRCNLASHQNPELVNFLPLVVQGEKRADLKISGGTVDSF